MMFFLFITAVSAGNSLRFAFFGALYVFCGSINCLCLDSMCDLVGGQNMFIF